MTTALPLGRFRVTYADGETEEVHSNFWGVMKIEQEFPQADAPFGTVLAFGIFEYLGRPGDDLEAWAKTVTMIEPVSDKTADPTPPIAGVA